MARIKSNPIVSARERAISDAIVTHEGKLRSIVFGRVRDQIETEDVLQEVFEEFIEAYDFGQIFESLGAWLTRVAQNKIVDRFRRRKTEGEAKRLLANPSPAATEAPGDNLLREELLEAIAMLPEDQREVFVKHELQGQSFEEIAQETGVGLNTLLSRKRYAVLFLRNYLKEIYDELE